MSAYRLDHVVIAVPELEAAGARLLDEHGLASVEGGRHEVFGTANRIVPLGDQYLELAAVVDDAQAMTHPFGSSVRALVEEDGGGLVSWCLEVEDLDGVASRLGLAVGEGARQRTDGAMVRWRMAGLEAALAEPWRPFYIQWVIDPAAHPGRMAAEHRVRPERISWIEVAGDPSRVQELAGDAEVDIRMGEGPPPLIAVGVATRDGEIALRGV